MPAAPESTPAEPTVRRSQPPSPTAIRKPARQKKARRVAEKHPRHSVERPSPHSVFAASLPVSHVSGPDADAAPPPARLIAFGLLALVLAGAAFLSLTARVSREWRV